MNNIDINKIGLFSMPYDKNYILLRTNETEKNNTGFLIRSRNKDHPIKELKDNWKKSFNESIDISELSKKEIKIFFNIVNNKINPKYKILFYKLINIDYFNYILSNSKININNDNFNIDISFNIDDIDYFKSKKTEILGIYKMKLFFKNNKKECLYVNEEIKKVINDIYINYNDKEKKKIVIDKEN